MTRRETNGRLRFAARSIDELCDQLAAFGAEVGPHLTR